MNKIKYTHREFCIGCIFKMQESLQKNDMVNIAGNLVYLEMEIRNQVDLDELMTRGYAFEKAKDLNHE